MATIYLQESNFKPQEQLLVSHQSIECSVFRYSTGVCGVRLKNKKGFLEILPYQGQQVWKAVFNGRDLTMKTPFSEPIPVNDFLKTFGGFVVHCGARRIGGPSNGEVHALHGDLPNAAYKDAWINTGSDEKGNFISISGTYVFAEFFGDHYTAVPVIKFYENSSIFDISMTITNKNSTPFELMYLCHINFRPVDNAQIVYSTSYTSEFVKVRATIPTHIKVSEEYMAFLKELKADPALHHQLKPGLSFDPEGVFYIRYKSDKDGFGHTMQIHPDGSADYVKHRTRELTHAARWISRTKNHDAIAIIEPATCEVDGYVDEKKQGNIKLIPAGQSYNCAMSVGLLDSAETAKMEKFIKENFN